MVDLYDGPCREGIRGGLEKFQWDSIKGQVIRDRECYLGQSVKIGIQGKFGRFSTNDWWISKRENPTTLQKEKELLKKLEDQLMLEALGVKPNKFSLIKGELTDAQKMELLSTEPFDYSETSRTHATQADRTCSRDCSHSPPPVKLSKHRSRSPPDVSKGRTSYLKHTNHRRHKNNLNEPHRKFKSTHAHQNRSFFLPDTRHKLESLRDRSSFSDRGSHKDRGSFHLTRHHRTSPYTRRRP